MSLDLRSGTIGRDLPVSDRLAGTLQRAAQITLSVQVAVCAMMLVAWLWGQTWLTDAALDEIPLKENGAAGLVLLGVVGLLLARTPIPTRARRIANLIAVAVVAIGAVTIVEWSVGSDFGIDHLLSRVYADAVEPTDRMPPQTALLLVIFGVSWISIDKLTSTGRWPAGYLITLGTLIAMSGLVGHLYKVPALYKIGETTAFPGGTALAFMAIAAGFACARPRRGLVEVLAGGGTGGRVGRLLLPSALLLPGVLGFLVLAGERAGLYDAPVAIWITTATVVFVAVLFVMRATFAAHSLDVARADSELALRRRERELLDILDTAQDAYMQFDGATGRVLSWNRAAQDLFGWRREEILGKPAVETLTPERLRPAVHGLLDRYLEHDPTLPTRGEWAGLHRDGHELIVEVAVSQIEVDDGLRINMFMHDIAERKRSEAELYRARAQLEGILENSPSSIYMKDRFGRYVFVSREIVRAWGIPAEQMVGKTDKELFPWVADDLKAEDRQVLITGSPLIGEQEFEMPAGKRIYLRVKFPLFDEKGIPYAVCGMATDVTEERRLEEKARAAEQRYRELVEELPLITYIAPIERDGLLFVSNQSKRILGYEPEELTDDEQAFGRMIHPDDHDRIYAAARHSKATGERLVEEYRMIARDGRTVWVREEGVCRFDDAGRPVSLQGFLKDVTERKLAEQAMRESSDQLQTVMATMSDGLLFADATGQIIYWNAAAEEIVGMTPHHRAATDRAQVYGLYESEDGPVLSDDRLPITRALAGEHVVDFPLYVRNEGLPEGRWVRTSANPFLLPDGSIGGAVAVLRDVTDRIRAEREQQEMRQRLMRSERLETVGQLAGGIAHDFNNLLAVIKTYAGFLAPHVEGTAAQDLDQVRAAADRAGELTRRLLVFSRRDPAKQRVLDLDDLISGSERLLRPLLGDRVELRLKLAAGVRVHADPAQMEQVLMNLATNSRDSMHDGGVLTITTAPTEVKPGDRLAHAGLIPGAHVRLVVRDSGTGMQSSVAEHAFEPFFTTKPSGQGTGLGLATVYGIVTDSGGHIEITSEPDRGTEIAIYLPVVADQVSTSDPPQLTPVPGFESDGKRLMVVEDEEPVRAAAVRILRESGYEVIDVADGEQALKLMSEDPSPPIDLLLTDVRMSPMSGIALAEQMQGLIPGLKVLFVTGYSDNLAGGSGGPMPSDAELLEKPFDANQLLGAVGLMLDDSSPVGNKSTPGKAA